MLRNYLIATILSACAFSGVATPLVAADQAQERYVTVFAGATFLNDIDLGYFVATLPAPSTFRGDVEIETDTGYNLGFAVGRRINENLRVEFELSQTNNKSNTFNFPRVVPQPYGGETEVLFALVNLWYDIPIESRIRPYVGGGVGAAHVKHLGKFPLQTFNIMDDSDTVFAGQIGLGGRIKVGERGMLDFGYRYKMTSGTSISTTNLGVQVDYRDMTYQSHNVSLGYTFSF